jgi:hypothetical protein
MTTLCTVLITIAACAVAYGIWHLFTCRDHRGGHARADVMHSPYTLAERVEREWEQRDAERQDTGKHHIRVGPDELSDTGLLSGDVSLLSGYACTVTSVPDRMHVGVSR